jgi:hypothetical protein
MRTWKQACLCEGYLAKALLKTWFENMPTIVLQERRRERDEEGTTAELYINGGIESLTRRRRRRKNPQTV